MDGIVFSGGIGEKSERFRAAVMDSVAWIEKLSGRNAGIDEERNSNGEGSVREITRDRSWIRGFLVETDEEAECIRLALEQQN